MLKEISIEIIRKCPNKCVHCSSNSDEYCIEILDYESFVSVVTDARNLGARVICISGGEPFLHHRIMDMIEFVNSLGVDSYVYTSGIIFDANNQRVSLDKDILCSITGKVTKLIFNIEGSNSSIYNAVMGTQGCFDKMKQSVVRANELSILTEAHFVPMKLNINEVEEVVSLCKKLNISKISFLRLVLQGRAKENKLKLELLSDELLKLQDNLEVLQSKSNIDVRIGVPLSKDLSHHKCEAANGKLNIKYDGNVYPCEVYKNSIIKDFIPDNIHEHSLCEIYKNSKYLKFIRKLSHEYSSNEYYETCFGQYLIKKNEEVWTI